MSERYKLPDSLGGHEGNLLGTSPVHKDGIQIGTFATLDVDGVGSMSLPFELLTKVVRLLPEPSIGSAVLDRDGDIWHRKPSLGGLWCFGARAESWPDLVGECGPVMQLYFTGPQGRGDRPDLALPTPASLPCADGRRNLVIEWGNRPGQVMVQVIEGEFFGRAAILDLDQAEIAAWTVLRIVEESRAANPGGVA